MDLATVPQPIVELVLSSESFQDQYLDMPNDTVHGHGLGDEHAKTGTASITWLNFQFAAQQAQAIAQAFSRLLPERKTTFESRYAELASDLLTLDQGLAAFSGATLPQPLVTSQPVYAYLAQRYGLNLKSVAWAPVVMPDEAQWQALQALLATHRAKWMIWDAMPLAASVDKLHAIGIQSVVFDPCGKVPAHGDFLSVMRQNVMNLRQALTAQDAASIP